MVGDLEEKNNRHELGHMTKTGSKESGPKAMTDGLPPAKLSRDIQARLGDQLRQMYNDVVSEGVPERFTDLLARLDQSGPGEGGDAAQ